MESIVYKVLVVNHSSQIRQMISRILNSTNTLEVIGEAENGHEALIKIPKLKPDVITLDIVSAEKKSLTTLKRIMIFHPAPVIIFAPFFQEKPSAIFDTLAYGAIDFIRLPENLHDYLLDKNAAQKQKEQLIKKVYLAAAVSSSAFQYINLKTEKKPQPTPKTACKNIVVLGVGEGGYGALLKIIPKLTVNHSTAYIIVSYEETNYLNAFIEYINYFSAVNVQPVSNEALLESGGCYMSSGDKYVTVHGKKEALMTTMSPAPFASRRGSIDMLMFSVAEALERPLGVILSGEGSDGAEGLEEIVRAGGGAIIQSPTNCLYDDMALSALNLCEDKVVVADREVATEINNFLIYSVN